MSTHEKDETQTEIGAAPARPSRLRRWVLRLAWVLGLTVALLVGTLVVLRITYHGTGLGKRASVFLSETMRGSVSVESIEWSMADTPAAIFGGWLPATVRGLEVYDEFGDLVLKTDLATAEVNIHEAIAGRNDFVFRRIVVPSGGYAKIKQVREPYPESEFDHDVVSLISAFYPLRPPEFRAGLSARPSRAWDLEDFEVHQGTLEFDFPEFYAIVYGVDGAGALRADASDPLAKKLYYTLTPTAPIGVLRIGETFEVLTDIEIPRLALIPDGFPSEAFSRDLHYQLTATATGGAKVAVTGAMLDHRIDFYGGEHDITLTVEDASLASKLIARDLSPEAASDIATESMVVRVTGPVKAPRVAMTVNGVTYAQPVGSGPPVELALDHAALSFDLATESGALADTIVRGLDGQVELAATFGLKPLQFEANLTISKPLQLRDYLPAQLRAVVGSSLSGSLHAIGDQRIQRLEDIDLRFGRARVRGEAYRTQTGAIGARGLHIEMDRTRARNIYGSINTNTNEVDLHMRRVESSDFGRLLERLGYPVVAESLDGFVHVGGTVENPYARGELQLGGVPVVSSVATSFSYGNQTLSINSAQARGYGGALIASGKLDLSGTPTLRGVTLSGRDLALSRVPGIGNGLSGRASIEATVSGPLSAPLGTATASLSNWTVAGDRFADTTISASFEPGGGFSVATDVAREDGGRLAINAGLQASGALSGDVELTMLPVSGILALAGLNFGGAGGTVSSKLKLSGTPSAPTANGGIEATRAWLKSGFLGNVTLTVERIDDGVIQLRGSLLQGRVQVDGSVATTAPFAADLELRFHRVEADQFLPELAREYGTRAWVSGSLSYRGDLSKTSRRPQFLARLTELEAQLENDDARGRPAPIRVVNRSPIEVAYDGENAKLAAPAVFSLPGGELTLAGEVKRDALAVEVKGTVALGLLRRYFSEQFEEIGGEVDVDFAVAGTVAAPELDGSFLLRDVSVKPAGQDASVRISAGRINISQDAITTTGVEIVVADEFSDEAASLNVSATVTLDGLEPQEWVVRADGDLGGKMLLVFAPDLFSAASGRAEIDLQLVGTGRIPNLDGEITFSGKDSLTFTPRGLRREVRLTGGSVTLEDDTISLSGVSGWVDDEGQIRDLRGDISLTGLRPESLDLSLSAEDVPLRIPGVLLLSVNLTEGRIIGNFEADTVIEDRLEVTGRIEVVDGRYIERWSPVINNLRPQRIAEAEPPFWKKSPLLGNARLGLRVASPAFFVRNNIADITMAGTLEIEGTPLEPRIEGVIRVDQGSFKIPAIRAKFTRTSGTVSFSEFRDFPTATPEIDITSESDYRDLRGQNHLIQMRLTGPLENLSWDLSTANGLNRAQTLTLVVSGRTPADARRLFGDEPVGRRPGEYASNLSTVDSESTAAVLDRVAKDLVGDQLDRILGDPIKNLTKLDVVRIEVGTASLGMHVEKDVTDSFRLLGDAERTLRGWSAALSAENRLNDTVSIEANGLEKRFDDETLEDERDLKLRLTWRKVLLP